MKSLSLTKLYSVSSELFFNEALTSGLLCLGTVQFVARIISHLTRAPHPQYQVTLDISSSPSLVSDDPGLILARIQLGFFCWARMPSHPWCFVLIMFHPRTQPPSHPLTINSHFSLLCYSWALDTPDTHFCPGFSALQGCVQLPIILVGGNRASWRRHSQVRVPS